MNEVEGKFYPLFWKASVKDAQAFIPLKKVETFGVQKYKVENILVTEFTVALDSKIFVRFYATEPLGKDGEILEMVAQHGRKDDYVMKSYPVTTHKEMMEYKVEKPEQVLALQKHFYTTYLAFTMKDFVEDQREEAVQMIDLKKKGEEGEDNLLDRGPSVIGTMLK